LRFLRAHPTANRRQRIGLSDNIVRRGKISFPDRLNKFWNIYIDRAAGDTGRVFTIETPSGLDYRHIGRVTGGDFIKIVDPHG
jgi:hypothetical protein